MPKVEQDAVLQVRLNDFLHERGLTVSSAARQMGVNRVSLWRFSTTGLARRDVRHAYSEALDRAQAKNETEAVSLSLIVQQGESVLDASELQRIRRTCESVLRLLDAYERRPLTSNSQGY